MLRKSPVAAMCIALGLLIATGCLVPTQQPPPELAVEGPVPAPIRHEKFFRGERELFGYKPRFAPKPVAFDADNRPYMRMGEEGKGWENTMGVVQTLDDQGRWIRLDFTDTIRRKYPTWDGRLVSNDFAEERIVFDDAGDVYMIVNCSRSNIKRLFLLHSRDKCRTWDLYELPQPWVRLEVRDGHNDFTRPPVILSFSGYKGSLLRLIVPTKKPDGTLSIPKAVPVSADDKARPLPLHSGAGNWAVTKGNLTHIAYLSTKPVPGREGTPQYVVTYDHSKGTFTEPVLLGFGGFGKPDVHNGPAIAIDSQGSLHVVMGAHHDPFKYTRSLKPDSTTSGWTNPVPIGKPNKPRKGSYTYVGLLCDGNDTLHVISRFAGQGYYFALDYLRKKAGGPWEDRGHLVFPFRPFYSCWYHKPSIDRKGRLFLSYIYYGDQYSDDPSSRCGDEIAAYRKKWPDESIKLAPDSRKKHGHWLGVRAHDPAMLISDDGGETWRLAVTKDFVDGLR